MAKSSRSSITLLILAGIGAGTLIGALIGLLLGRRAGSPSQAEIAETVDDLRNRAQQVLGELSENVTELVDKSRALLDETRTRVGDAVQAGKDAAAAQVETLQETIIRGAEES